MLKCARDIQERRIHLPLLCIFLKGVSDMFDNALLPMLLVFVDVSVADFVQACAHDLLVCYYVLCIFSSEVLLPLFLKSMCFLLYSSRCVHCLIEIVWIFYILLYLQFPLVLSLDTNALDLICLSSGLLHLKLAYVDLSLLLIFEMNFFHILMSFLLGSDLGEHSVLM